MIVSKLKSLWVFIHVSMDLLTSSVPENFSASIITSSGSDVISEEGEVGGLVCRWLQFSLALHCGFSTATSYWLCNSDFWLIRSYIYCRRQGFYYLGFWFKVVKSYKDILYLTLLFLGSNVFFVSCLNHWLYCLHSPYYLKC